MSRLRPAAVPLTFSPAEMCFIRTRSQPGFHESVFCSLQALRDKDLGVFEQTVQQAR